MAPDPTQTLGYALVSWFEHYLCHGPGDVQGQPIVHDVEDIEFWAEFYRVDQHGVPVYDEAFMSRSKGYAKSEQAGEFVCGEFVGPTRFDHWAEPGEVSPWGYEYQPGEPVGRAVTYPFIRCLATEEGQAGNTYDNVTVMLAHLVEHFGAEFPGIDIGVKAQTSTRVFLDGGGEIRPSTASSAAKDGGKETAAVADETHLYVKPELREMHKTVKRNLGKRRLSAGGTKLLQTSTMYGIGEESVAEQTHKASQGSQVPRLLFSHVEAPEHLNPERAEDRAAGLRHCYGSKAHRIDIAGLVAEYRDPRTDPSDWLRYYWNRAQAGATDLVNGAEWDTKGHPDSLARGDAVALGFDGSRSDDTTALIACRLSDCRLFEIGVWERPEHTEGPWRVPRDDVDKTLTAAFDAYDVVMMFGDPSKWEPYFDMWSARWPKRISEEWPGDKRTDRNLRLFRTAYRDGSLTHDGSAKLTAHVKAAVVVKGKPRPAGEVEDNDDPLARYYLRIRKRADGRKIDAAWAAMLAVAARGWAIEHGVTSMKQTGGWVVSL